jgi:hypothetical protein
MLHLLLELILQDCSIAGYLYLFKASTAISNSKGLG